MKNIKIILMLLFVVTTSIGMYEQPKRRLSANKLNDIRIEIQDYKKEHIYIPEERIDITFYDYTCENVNKDCCNICLDCMCCGCHGPSCNSACFMRCANYIAAYIFKIFDACPCSENNSHEV